MADSDVVQLLRRCRCCLRDAPAYELAAPSAHDAPHTYAHMLKKCFDIELPTYIGYDGCGICALCVARLGDASDFKRQVQRSQAALQALLERALHVKEEEPAGPADVVLDEGALDEPMICRIGVGYSLAGNHTAESGAEQDKAAESGPGLDGAAEFGAEPDESGSGLDGATESGAEQDEAAESGPESDKAAESGPGLDGAAECGAEPDESGPGLDGATESGAEPDEAAESGPESDEAAESGTESDESTEQADADRPQPDAGAGHDDDVKSPHSAANTEPALTVQVPRSGKRKLVNSDEQGDRGEEKDEKDGRKPKRTKGGPLLSPSLHGVTNKKVKEKEERRAENTSVNSMSPLHLNPSLAPRTPENPAGSSSASEVTLTAETNFECEKCHKGFNIKSDLEKHFNTHLLMEASTSHKASKFTCHTCNCTFDTKLLLQEHEKSRGVKYFACAECDYAAKHASSLQTHVRTHTGEKPFKCSQCNAAFSSSSQLQKHNRTHTGEKPYKCSKCTGAFTNKSNLQRHLRTHTGEKSFKCSQCSNRFSQSVHLQRHLKTHTGEKSFKCSQCTSTFRESDHLQRHVQTHTGEKPFDCSICGYKATQKCHLKQHTMSRHSALKPFGCDACGYTGATKNHLRNHMKTHHWNV